LADEVAVVPSRQLEVAHAKIMPYELAAAALHAEANVIKQALVDEEDCHFRLVTLTTSSARVQDQENEDSMLEHLLEHSRKRLLAVSRKESVGKLNVHNRDLNLILLCNVAQISLIHKELDNFRNAYACTSANDAQICVEY